VIAALATVLWAPGHPATRWVDLGGSVAVALYLLASAQRTLTASVRTATGVTVDADRPMP
jgi:hypothetical protein